ncbi:hypothetical protein PHMEG_00011293 [Phytophthora megakarya]|uniref:Reverse transcriptase/retrotransposon-derived protein RNase H-like domain-containing protein n=1 Tax=Phytophthora megakarya TaxID=4795 RepID=A0A225WCJ7_9STRA|nr:hypothetical protein PHMEG_00011293 [Phytophthora megakarya]
MTHRGMVTPTRVLMGGTDAVGYCQSVVKEVFQPLLYHGLLAWLDDILSCGAPATAMCSELDASVIPNYAKMVSPLMHLVDVTAKKKAQSRKAAKLSKILLAELGWNGSHAQVIKKVKAALLEMVPLAHPDPNMTVCLYTDASLDFWGAVCTQIPEEELALPIGEQHHRPVAFLRGRFVNALSR